MENYRILFAAGPGDVIRAHEYWKAGKDDPTQTALTFSSQFEDFCRDIGAPAYIISYNEKKQKISDGDFILEHRPKPLPSATGLGFHIREIIYGIGLVWTAVRFGANYTVIDSGSTHYFVLLLFRLAGIKVIAVLHNTLWPSGFFPRRRVQRLISWLDSLFFQYGSIATIGVSPECIRQFEQLTGGKHGPVYELRGQYRREYFAHMQPPPIDLCPFRIMFAGRIVLDKGVFDILEMARMIEAHAPGRVKWEIAGGGPDLEELKREHSRLSLNGVVTIHGWTSPHDLPDIISKSHASIVPTRSSFAEGLALTAAEAILAGRPVITSPVVPALEILRPACVEARPNDPRSYVDEILKLINNPDEYRRLCNNCSDLQGQFYDRQRGFTSVLLQAVTQSHLHKK